MSWPFFGESPIWSSTIPASVMVVSLFIAWVFFFALGRLARSRGPGTGADLAGAVLSALRVSVAVAIVLMGAYLGVLSSPYLGDLYPYLAGALPVVLALLAVYVSVVLLSAVVRWYGFQVAGRSRTRVSNVIVPFLRMTLPLGGLLIALLLVLEALGIRVGPISAWLLEHGGRAGLIVVLALAALLVAEQGIPPMVNSAVRPRTGDLEEEARKRSDTLARALVTAVQIAATVVAAFMIIAEMGVNIGPLLAGVGVAGIAIGFGTQSLVKDFVGGFFIIAENQYRIGDVVKVGEVAGLVEDVSLRRTVLRDLDGVVHSVPNGDVRVASNFTREWSRVNLNVAVTYREDPDRVMALIDGVGRTLAQDPAWAALIVTPPQAQGVDYFGDGSFEVKILGETRPIRQWEVMRELRLRIKKLFDQEGIEIRPSQQGMIRQMALPQQARSARGPRPRHRDPRTGQTHGPRETGQAPEGPLD